MARDPDAAAASARFDRWLIRLAVGALLILSLTRWPTSLSFSDEVGYLGQARLILSGRISPTAADPGVFEPLDEGGRVSRYPLFIPLLVTPLLAVHPRLVFALGAAGFAAILWIASRILSRWGRPRLLALLFAIHPTFVLLGYTAMSDLFLVAAALAAFDLGERQRRLAGLAYALLVLAKPVGALIAGGLLLGAALARRTEGRSLRFVLGSSLWPIAGAATGGLVAVGLNWMSWRHFGYSYDVLHGHLGGGKPFSLDYLSRSAPGYLLSLLMVPPGLLLLGPLGLWRRRCYGPLFVAAGLMAMMATYFFVDRGRSRLETLVLGQRLILPASAFLLLGYAEALAPLFAVTRLARALSLSLALVSMAAVYVIGTRLRGWQADAHNAYTFARDELARQNGDALGTTEFAMKAALMHRGPVVMASATTNPRVVICNLASGSYRFDLPASCDLPGYDAIAAYGTFRVLRQGPSVRR